MTHRSITKLLSIVALLAIVLQPLTPVIAQPIPALAAAAPTPPQLINAPGVVFRTTVRVTGAQDLARLEKLGVALLTTDDRRPTTDAPNGSVSRLLSVVVLADAAQLEALARLRFEPHATDDLSVQIAAQASDKAWLASSLQPLMAQAKIVAERRAQVAAAALPDAATLAPLRATMKALTPEQMAGIAALTSVDDDGDGLSNTEEAWWCTDPMNPNSDGDATGYTDGQEVAALLDFTLPRTVRWNYGPPFGPPNAWPDFNNRDSNPATPACNDGDYDTIPDYAEAYVIGTRVGTGDSENTDGDKFDDGQELFGTTFCPGGTASCQWGNYPRTQDYSFITSGMPSWIRPPGDSPFVAAYPVIDFLVDPATVEVTTKEIRTIERTITQGEEISTGFAETQGNSTTVGTVDTNTHNTWQENSTTEGGIEPASVFVVIPNSVPGIPPATSALPGKRLSVSTSEVTQPTQAQSAICWGDSMQRAHVDGLTELQTKICEVLLASISSADIRAVADNHLALPSGEELLVNRISEYNSKVDGHTYVWVDGSIRPQTRRSPELYTELYAILRLQGTDWIAHFAGSQVFKDLLPTVPDSIVPQASKESLSMWADPQPQPLDTHFYLPWTKGDALNVYTQAPHGGTWAWDFQTDSNGTLLRATRSGYVYSYDEHTGYGCTDDYHRRANWVLINHGDGTASLYLHIRAGGALRGKESGWGEWVDQGTPVAVSGNSGYSYPCPGGVHHLHFQVQKWNNPPNWNSGEQYYNGVFSYDSYKVRFEEYINTDTIPSPATSQNQPTGSAGGICGGLEAKSTDPQPNTLPATTKRTWFEEILGRLFKGWKGKNASGSWITAAEVTSATALPGCSGGTCSDQVAAQNSIAYNFSDSKSDGQCGGNGYSGGDSPAGVGGGGGGLALNDNGDGTWDRLRVWSETHTSGEGWSTSHSELRSQTEYSEITRSQSNTLVSSEAWSTATTTDPTDAAALTFNYNLYNTGSDAAVRLTGIKINILIGDLPVITQNLPDSFDILPGGAKGPFGSGQIKLTLDQVAAIDNGAPIRVVLADYGYDDNLYDDNAWGRSVLFHVDDGTADGDEMVDTYLITTNLVQGETYQDTLARYFDVTTFQGAPGDERNDTITSIRTPEFAPDGEISGWNDHPVNEHGWWELSISLGGETAGVKHFKEMPAKPKTDVYLRYVLDMDADGYTDRAERDAGTDPGDSQSHPKPLLAVAQHTSVSGSNATVQVSLQNEGNFDASSVELWAVAPDDSITINDNLVGGGGRVRAGRQVVLGARIGKPVLSAWTTSTAKPYPDGQFEGASAKNYSFRADANGNIGTTAGLTISWSGNGGSTWTPLALGTGYTAWTPLPLADGLSIAFSEGYVSQGETFSFQTALPIDTFAYTINRTPYTKPLIIASYNDPEGNHKFVSNVELDHIQDDLAPYLGRMRYGFQMDVMSQTTFNPGANTAYIVFNNPSDMTISGSNVFVEFATPDGSVAKEYVLSGQTFYPGPNVATLNWNTADFSPAFDPAKDYHILVFAADRQGTIFENTVKDLDQVGKDRLPLAVLPDSEWDFGTAQQGTLLQHTIAVANTGYNNLLAFVESTPGLELSAQGSASIQAADLALYDLTLRTQELPEGPFERQVKIRTSDPAHPAKTITIRGNVTAMPPDAPGGATLRPLDVPVTVTGNKDDWKDFTHALGPEPLSSLHPIKVWSQDYNKLWGVGRYALTFRPTGITAIASSPAQIGGTGRDGDLYVPPGQVKYIDMAAMRLQVTSPRNSTVLSVQFPKAEASGLPDRSTSSIRAGDEVMIIAMKGPRAGEYESATIASASSDQLILQEPLRNDYLAYAESQTQIIRVPHYRNVTGGGTITTQAWDGHTGGVLVLRALNVSGIDVSVTASGYLGGYGNDSAVHVGGIDCGSSWATQGDSPAGNGWCSRSANLGGGGAAKNGDSSGGGGGYGTSGGNGANGNAGYGGGTYGDPSLNTLYMGSGGGGGSWNSNPYGGGRYSIQGNANSGRGGGTVFLTAETISNVSFDASGDVGGNSSGGYAGGGGAGGSIKLIGVSISSVTATAFGGAGGIGGRGNGGAGGVGRIRVEYCNAPSVSSNPSASVVPRTDCFIAEQVESSPFTQGRVKLPESATDGRTYQVQYGRKLNWNGATSQVTTLRVPAGIFTTVTLQALISDLPSNAWFALDVGDTGSDSWNGMVSNGGEYTSPNLAAFFNAYWASHGAPTAGTLDVPVRVSLDRAGQVLLTNLQVIVTGSKTRYLRLPIRPQGYSNITVSFTVSGGAGPLAVGADVGGDGSVEWMYTGAPAYPASLTTGNLAAAINAYVAGKSDEVEIPIRFNLAPFATLNLTGFSATSVSQVDASISASDIAFSAPAPTEGDEVTVNATLHNPGSRDTGPLTASFVATPAGGSAVYIGSAFVDNVPAGGTASASIPWNTLGFTGNVAVRVTADPFNRVAESDETNNQATGSLTVRTRPDLSIPVITLSDPEPTAGEVVTVTLTVSNTGQTTAGAQTVVLYDGNPDAGGVLVGDHVGSPLPGAATTAVMFTWTPAAPGPHRLFARSDRDRQVNESNENNNDALLDVYVGFSGAIMLDSGGGDTYDPPYSATIGFGYLNGSANAFCGTAAGESQRSESGGTVRYRFDHLLPGPATGIGQGHFYHLDLTLYECDGLGRQQQIRVDDNPLGDPIDLSDGKAHRLSFRLDPAFYADRSIVVSIEELTGYDAVIGEINLYDVDYRYADSGRTSMVADTSDPNYPVAPPGHPERSYGWLDGVDNRPTGWGTLPYQTRRMDLADSNPADDPDNELRYRFDGLQPGLRYQLHLSFYQKIGGLVQQSIAVDDIGTGATVELNGMQRVDKTVDVPPGAYAGDGSIVVRITRTNATAGAFVNEIALEQLTLLPEAVEQVTQAIALHSGGPNWFSFNVKPPVRPAAACTGVTPTSAFTTVYGAALLAGAAAPAGSIVEAYTPAGLKVGCFRVGSAGLYGYMKVYGTEGAMPGMTAGQPIFFKINGIAAKPTPEPVIWQDDKGTHPADLAAADLIPVETLLSTVSGKYSRLLSENGSYLPPPADPRFNTCTSLAGGQGYLLYATQAVNLQPSGTRIATDTPIPLHAGWNWLGYLPTCELPVATALAGIAGSYDILHSEAGTYRPPPANPAYNNFTTMAPGRGYMIHATTAVTLTYPAGLCGGALSAPSDAPPAVTSCAAVATGRFTTFYGQVLSGDRPLSVAGPVLAYTPRGEVVGCSQVSEAGLYGYMRVYGADGDLPGALPDEPIRFTVGGMLAYSTTVPLWANDFDVHRVDLKVATPALYLPMVTRQGAIR